MHAAWCGLAHTQHCTVIMQVDVVHRGQVSLKGVPRPVTAMMLVPVMLSGRRFPDILPGSKATLVAKPRGLQCSVKLPADA